MIKICPGCNKQFGTHDKRKKYCSVDCAKRGKCKRNSVWNKGDREYMRKVWARQEAYYLNALAHECGVDTIADYIYNNYQRYKGNKGANRDGVYC